MDDIDTLASGREHPSGGTVLRLVLVGALALLVVVTTGVRHLQNGGLPSGESGATPETTRAGTTVVLDRQTGAVVGQPQLSPDRDASVR